MSREPTAEEIEAAARALYERPGDGTLWSDACELADTWRGHARAALEAAAALSPSVAPEGLTAEQVEEINGLRKWALAEAQAAHIAADIAEHGGPATGHTASAETVMRMRSDAERWYLVCEVCDYALSPSPPETDGRAEVIAKLQELRAEIEDATPTLTGPEFDFQRGRDDAFADAIDLLNGLEPSAAARPETDGERIEVWRHIDDDRPEAWFTLQAINPESRRYITTTARDKYAVAEAVVLTVRPQEGGKA